MSALTTNTEYILYNNDCEVFNCRIYNDNSSKIENVNVLHFCLSIEDLQMYMLNNGLKIKEILG